MESRIRLKASRKEIYDLFDNKIQGAEGISLKYFEELKEGSYDAIIRHKELSKNLKGTFKIKKLIDTINAKSEELEYAKELIKEFIENEYGYSENLEHDILKYADLSKIGIAYTQTEDGEHDISVYANLVNNSIDTYIDEKLVESNIYQTLSNFIETELRYLEFDNLVQIETKVDSKDKEWFSKGDVIKTSLSDDTLVLKVKDGDAILFTGSQFIVAYGIQKQGDKVYWNRGEYYDELPESVFEKDRLKDVSKEELEKQTEELHVILKEYEKINKDHSYDFRIRGIEEHIEVLEGLSCHHDLAGEWKVALKEDQDQFSKNNENFSTELEDDWELEP